MIGWGYCPFDKRTFYHKIILKERRIDCKYIRFRRYGRPQRAAPTNSRRGRSPCLPENLAFWAILMHPWGFFLFIRKKFHESNIFFIFSPLEIKYDFIYNIYMSENELLIDIVAASIPGSNFLVSNYLVSFLSNQPVRWEV